MTILCYCYYTPKTPFKPDLEGTLGKKKKNVLFPETSEYFLGSVEREFFVILRIFFTLEKHENHSKYPKNREKNIKCLKKI